MIRSLVYRQIRYFYLQQNSYACSSAIVPEYSSGISLEMKHVP